MDFQCGNCGWLVTDKQWQYCPKCGYKLYMYDIKRDTEIWENIMNITRFLKDKLGYEYTEKY